LLVKLGDQFAYSRVRAALWLPQRSRRFFLKRLNFRIELLPELLAKPRELGQNFYRERGIGYIVRFIDMNVRGFAIENADSR
jgi:hypothetical protein